MADDNPISMSGKLNATVETSDQSLLRESTLRLSDRSTDTTTEAVVPEVVFLKMKLNPGVKAFNIATMILCFFNSRIVL